MTEQKAQGQTLKVLARNGEDPQMTTARFLTGAHVASALVETQFSQGLGGFDLNHAITALEETSARVNKGDLAEVEAMLVSQASALNIMFSELARRAALNMGSHLEATKAYLTMALKAQNQSRMTLETLANVKNPPVVYAKQANIANGPQQVNNGALPQTSAQADQTEKRRNKLLEQQHGEWMDAGASAEAGRGNQEMAAVEKVNGAEDGRGKVRSRAKRLEGRSSPGLAKRDASAP